jgi:hypothetical protein
MKTVLLSLLILMIVLPLRAIINQDSEFWLSSGLGFGSSNSGGSDAQFGGFLQGILQNNKLTYSAHYQGFSQLNLIEHHDILTGEPINITDREINKGHILGWQVGFVSEDMALKKQWYETSQSFVRFYCAVGVSCNFLSKGTHYTYAYPEHEGWRDPYHWKTAIGFPLSLDLTITNKRGGIRFTTYYNYNTVAPLLMIEVGFIGRLDRAK